MAARLIPFSRKPVLALAPPSTRRGPLETRRFQLVRRVARVLGLVHARRAADTRQQASE